jgi:N-methylhydantoinase A
VTKTNQVSADILNNAFQDMKVEGDNYLEREGITPNDRYYRNSIDMRYKGQFHEVELPISEAKLTDESIEHIVEDFHKKHEELYAYRDVVETEMINLRMAAYGKVVTPSRKAMTEKSTDVDKYVKGKRDVYFEKKYGFVPTTIYDGDRMEAGNIVEGPAIIEQKTTTVVVPPMARLEVTEYGDYLMKLK